MKRIIAVLWCLCLCFALFATQTSNSVSVTDNVYYLLEQAQMKGLCSPLPTVKPYTERMVVQALDEILSHQELKEAERQVVADYRAKYERKPGWDWQRGASYSDHETKKGTHITLDVGAKWDSLVSMSYSVQNKKASFGTDDWGTVFLAGDMGEHFSWSLSASGGMILAPHTATTGINPFYKGYVNAKRGYLSDGITVYTEPSGYFPFTFTKRWDSSVFVLSDLSASGYKGWPQTFSFGYNLISEMSSSLLEDKLFFRFGRFTREWGTTSSGNSLVLNSNARPFVGIESSYRPFSWLSFSALTGVLEYMHSASITDDAATFQNAFSIASLELDYKNYFHFDVGSSCIWPKRFELGYLFPLNSNFFYQNNIGDFDNLGLSLNITGTWPGVGKLWFSFFGDEFDLSTKRLFFEMDRNMYAFQVGLSVDIPWVPFSTLSIQYTKIEPYCYTHQRIQTPWYGDSWMVTSYMNNGVGIGYYLPPNSDELKLRYEMMPVSNAKAHVQYQMVRHGAESGHQIVDGSSYLSELDPDGRNEKLVLRKHFLHDGAYQWYHIVKLGGEYSLAKQRIPITFYGDVGVSLSYFTVIDNDTEVNDGYSHASHIATDDADYPFSTDIIFSVGFKVYY